jgi:uncharacterized protein (TIGR04255 family)
LLPQFRGTKAIAAATIIGDNNIQGLARDASRSQMLFPDQPRVIYRKRPTEEVICQLRFPTLLRIDAEPPVAFQERIRRRYPVLTEKKPEFPTFPQEMMTLIGADFRIGKPAYEFATEDAKWKVTLAADYISLATSGYERWEIFRDHLIGPFESLLQLYAPSFFTRVGLRYRDVIMRSRLGLKDAPWSELLQPAVAGALSVDRISSSVIQAAKNVTFNLPGDCGQLRVRHGLGATPGSEEPCYVIDADFFTVQKKEPSHALDTLDTFHIEARLFFQWCITRKLHDALDPEPV